MTSLIPTDNYPVPAAPSPDTGKMGGEGDELIRRMAYGYAIMHTAICNMAGTSGAFLSQRRKALGW